MFFPKGGTEEPFPVSLSLWLLPPPPRIPVVTAPASPTGGGGIPLWGHGRSQHMTSHSTRTDEWTAVPVHTGLQEAGFVVAGGPATPGSNLLLGSAAGLVPQ